MTKILVTGATSFIGNKFVEDLLFHTDWDIYSLERLPSHPSRLGSLERSSRIHRLHHDLRAEVPAQIVHEVSGVSYLVHLAADVSGVKSLADPVLSVTTNVVGTFNTLELARKLNLSRFVYISTGEVTGRVKFPEALAEDAPLRPSNPYAASKAAGEALINAYRVSYGVPAIIIRSMNVFGPRQQLTRFIPATIKNLLEDRKISCHVDNYGSQGSRNWLHVDKFTGMIEHLLEKSRTGEVYHVVGPEKTNLEVIRSLAQALGKSFHIENVVAGPSHDLRYALRDTKLSFKPLELEQDLEQTVRWYQDHREWLA